MKTEGEKRERVYKKGKQTFVKFVKLLHYRKGKILRNVRWSFFGEWMNIQSEANVTEDY